MNNPNFPMNAVPLPLNPSSPPIFVGHFGIGQSADGCPCIPGHELILPGPVVLEGIHVVPGGFSPPGLPLQGLTSPTMAVRPFTLHMFARNCADSQIISVFALTIHGGVQWMAIPPPFNSMVVDLIAFDGDYEALTIIVHAFPCDPLHGSLSHGKQEDVPEYTDESEPEEPEPVEPVIEDSPLYQLQASNLAAKTVNNQQLNNRLKKLTLKSTMKQDMQAKIEGHLPCTYFGNSLVSLKHVAALVGEIFSFAESYSQTDDQTNKTAESFTSQIGLLDKLSEYLDACWQQSDASDAKDSVIGAIGPEAANLLCSIVVNALADCNFDTFLVEAVESVDERKALFEKYTSAVLQCCSAIMGNAYIALEFSECNGVPALSGLLRQQPHLTSSTFQLLLTTLWSAVKHYDIGVKFNEPVEDQQYVDEQGNAYMQQEISPYQSLLYIAAALTGDAEATPLCGKIYRWCALVESQQQLLVYSYTVFDDIAKVSEALAARLAAVNSNTSSTAEESEDGPNEGSTDSGASLHPCCDIVAALFGSLSTKVHTLQASIASCLTDLEESLSSNSEDSYSRYCALLHTFSRGKLLVVLIALASLSQVAQDLSLATDWKAPHSPELTALSQSSQQLLVSLLNQLFSIPYFDTLFALHSEEVQILFKILSSHSNMITSLSLQELGSHSVVTLSPVDATAVLVSYGWSMWLSSYTFALCLNALSKVKLDPDTAAETALTSSQVEGLNAFLREWLELSSHHVSRSWAVRVITSHFLSEVLSVIHRLCVNVDEHPNAADVFSMLVLLLEKCCASAIQDTRAVVLGKLRREGVRRAVEEVKRVVSRVDGLDKKLSKDRVIRLMETNASDADKEPRSVASLLSSFSVKTITDETENVRFVRDLASAFVRGSVEKVERVKIVQEGSLIVEKCVLYLRDLKSSLCKSDLKTVDDEADGEGNFDKAAEQILSGHPSVKRQVLYCTSILNTLCSVVALVERVSKELTLRQNISTTDKLALTVVDLYTTVYQMFNGSSSDETGALSREVSSLCVRVLSHYCPSFSNSALDSCLLSYLVHLAFRDLSNFEAVTSLLNGLLPGRLNLDKAEFEIQRSSDNWSSFALKKRNSGEVALVQDWCLFLDRSPKPGFESSIVIKHSKKHADSMEVDDAAASNRSSDQLLEDLKNKKLSVETLIVGGLVSTSADLLSHLAGLVQKICGLSTVHGRKIGAAISRVVKSISQAGSSSVSSLHRLLVWLDSLCQSSTSVTILLVHGGLLAPVLEALEKSFSGQSVLLTLQLLGSIYRSLSRVVNTVSHDAVKYGTLVILESVAFKLTKQLPHVVRRSTDFVNSLAVLQMVPITVQLLTSQHYQAFLTNLSSIGEGVTLEFVAVKLWIAFEEAFKQISETSDPRKSKHSKSKTHDTDNGEAVSEEKKVYYIHAQCERTAWSLLAIVDITLKAYTEGWIPLVVLTRAMRTTQTDPKKITRRIQRAYTMWSTGLLGTIDEDGAYHRSSHHTVDSSSCVRTMSENDSFESRHAVLCYALKSLVDSMNVVAKHAQSRERITPSNSKVVIPPAGVVNLNLNAPFAVAAAKHSNFESQLTSCLSCTHVFNVRVSDLMHRASQNALHVDFRGDIVKYTTSNAVDGFALRFQNNFADSLVEIKRRQSKINRKRKLRVKKTSSPPANAVPHNFPGAPVPPPSAPTFPGHLNRGPPGPPQPPLQHQPPSALPPSAFNPFAPPPPPPPVFAGSRFGALASPPAAPAPPVQAAVAAVNPFEARAQNPFEAPARFDPFTYKPPTQGR